MTVNEYRPGRGGGPGRRGAAGQGVLRGTAGPGGRRPAGGLRDLGASGVGLKGSFNEAHILATTEAICRYRNQQGIDGPLYLGRDTHALSEPAQATALEVRPAGVQVRVDAGDRPAPTPAISHAILAWNRDRRERLADGIVIAPSHNPPEDGGFKYNPPNGGPADTDITGWVQDEANRLLVAGLDGVQRVSSDQAAAAPGWSATTTWPATCRAWPPSSTWTRSGAPGCAWASTPSAGRRSAWSAIAEHYRLELEVVNQAVDPTFGFMTLDWDGKIRMDPSSRYAMAKG